MKILSGIQPTGELHIGNYLGALKQWITLQEGNECFFPIVDLHAITIPYDPKELKKKILDTAASYLALGLDPSRCAIFIQSEVKEHTELCWILNTITPVSELERMTQYKDKSRQFKKNINAGLLNYPILQAADILLYQTDLVPVGKDQEQHVEFARLLAKKFNNKFAKVFKEPKSLMPKAGSRIMSFQDPKKKMSKSLGPKHYLSLFEEPRIIKEKVMSAVTDLGKDIKYDPKKKPGISNLLTIFSLISGKSIKELEKQFNGRGYQRFKEALSEALIKELEPFRRKKISLESRTVYIEEILNRGADQARTIAQSTMEQVLKAAGLA